MLHSAQFSQTVILNVKLSLDMARHASISMRHAAGVACCTLLLAACGQTGPLYLPVRPALPADNATLPKKIPAVPAAPSAPAEPAMSVPSKP
jgi:predicted small lipoprotein YifL